MSKLTIMYLIKNNTYDGRYILYYTGVSSGYTSFTSNKPKDTFSNSVRPLKKKYNE